MLTKLLFDFVCVRDFIVIGSALSAFAYKNAITIEQDILVLNIVLAAKVNLSWYWSIH